MPVFCNINGTWRTVSQTSCQINGVWRNSQPSCQIGGVWRSAAMGIDANTVTHVEFCLTVSSFRDGSSVERYFRVASDHFQAEVTTRPSSSSLLYGLDGSGIGIFKSIDGKRYVMSGGSSRYSEGVYYSDINAYGAQIPTDTGISVNAQIQRSNQVASSMGVNGILGYYSNSNYSADTQLYTTLYPHQHFRLGAYLERDDPYQSSTAYYIVNGVTNIFTWKPIPFSFTSVVALY